jgi:2-polyprenyl-3-methyl-5-hydroxy-6-metoxy-1,4-benzoquinol methylase
MKKKENVFLECIDYTVSRETFSLLKDNELEMLITLPKPKELSKYYESEEYISHTDSKKTVIDKIYQKAKKRAIKKKLKLINSLSNKKKTKTILDIGCGTGDFLLKCNLNDWYVTGVDPNKKARVLAKHKLQILTSKFESFHESQPKILEKIEMVETNKKFDIITMWHALEHVSDLDFYIKQLKVLLKEGGTLVVAVPNFKSYDAKYYGKFWAAYDVPRHLWHFSQKTIKLLFEKETMKVIKTLPMKLDSYYVSLLSEKNKTGKTKYVKSFLIGLKSNFKAKRTKEYSSLIYIIKNE